MNKQSLDERIEEYVDSHQYIGGDLRPVPYDEIYPDFKQIIKDVIQEVLPEKKDQLSQSTLEDESRCRFYRYGGYNRAIDTINSNLDNLLTGEKH